LAVRIGGDAITDSPGEIIGYTEYDYQTNGSSGNRCAADTDGGVHFTWMKGIQYPDLRNVYYNYLHPNGNWLAPGEGLAIGMANGAGYIQLALTSDNRAGVVYHESALDFVTYAVDEFPGFGIFVHFDPPDMLTERCYWPYVAIDRNDGIHILMREELDGGISATLGYIRSLDGGISWSDPVPVDSITTLSQCITASPVSEKVAIAYTHPTDLEIQWINDVYYIESENGTYWDWRNDRINLTEYGSGGDSLFAYTDLAAIYDYNDNLHIIWNAWYASQFSVGDTAFLYHYDYGTGIITSMNARKFDYNPYCDVGHWSMAIAKMSLGIHEPSGCLFVVYTVFDASDCSAGGYANGEIFMQYSTDNGLSWSVPENLTNSPTPNCAPGDCDSDHWSSLADRVDDYLHIMYINDKDAGGIPQDEGNVTNNPVLYLAYPNPILRECDYIEGDVNHNTIPLELDDVVAMIGNYRGILPPYYTCRCAPHGSYFPATADPNGNCVPFELVDVVTELGAYMGIVPLSSCPDCPGSGMLHGRDTLKEY
jgi:hypothetical protein